MAAEKGGGWDDSLKDLQARIDALARRRKDEGPDEGPGGGHSSAEVARALRAHRRRDGSPDRGAPATQRATSDPAQPASTPDTSPSCGAGSPNAAAVEGQPIVYRRDLPRRAPPVCSRARPAGPSVALDEAEEGCEVAAGDAGKAFVIPTRVDEIEGAKRFSGQFSRRLGAADSGMAARIEKATGLRDVTVRDMVFFDIESTGLAYSPLFLIGAMVWEGDGLVVHQFMARTYAEEAAVIALFADLCRERCLLISFNGKSYDLPAIRVRAAATRANVDAMPEAHYDLLHESRRVWRDVLPDCRLQTLELYVCKRGRKGDIPSAQIPTAYHAFVRSGDAWEMVEVLKHNKLDLLTLADLMTRLPPLEEAGADA